MSQKTEGLLNEEEVKSYLNEAFNLKLTRDTLLNPKKDVVIDLYTKFLDYRSSKWRRLRTNPNATLLATMVSRLRFMLKGYIPGHDKREFHSGDLVMPDRRRTNFFLNALIFTKVQVDDIHLEWQQWLAEWKQSQEIAQKIDQKLEKEKNELENLAIKKSQSKSLDELREEIRKKRAIAQDLESRYDEAEREKNRIKESITARAEQRKKLELQVAKFREDVEEKEKKLHLLDSGKGLKNEISELQQCVLKQAQKLEGVDKKNQDLLSKIAGVEKLVSLDNLDEADWSREVEQTKALISKTNKKRAALEEKRMRYINTLNSHSAEEESLKDKISKIDEARTKQRIQFKIMESQAEADAKEAKFNREKEMQQFSLEINKLNEELVSLDKMQLKAEEDRDKTVKQLDEHVEKLEQRFNTAAKGYQSFKQPCQQAALDLQSIIREINYLLGKPKEVTAPLATITSSTFTSLPADQSYAANRTYIKEKEQ